MAFLFTRIFRYVIFVVVLFSLIQYALKHVEYTISPRHFRTSVEKVKDQPIKTALSGLISELRLKYSTHILPDRELEWFHLNINGLNMRTMLLHASTTEYIAVYAVPLSASGFVSSHWMNQTCSVISGRVYKSATSTPISKAESFEAGSNMRLASFEPTFVQADAETFIVCYGRGFVPLSTVHVKWGTLVNSGDVVSWARFWWAYTQSAAREFATFSHDLYGVMRRRYLG